MKSIRSTFKKLAEPWRREKKPAPQGIWTYDLPRIDDAVDTGNAKELTFFVDKYGVDRMTGVVCDVLHRVSAKGHVPLIKLLLDRGADIGIQNCRDATPLHLAAEHGKEAAVEYLIGRGAAVNPQDGEGRTPLMAACRRGRNDAVDMLLRHGARLDMTDDKGLTAKTIALKHGHNAAAVLIDEETATREGHRLRSDITVRSLRLKKRRPS